MILSNIEDEEDPQDGRDLFKLRALRKKKITRP
jgi:hypothetical protein